MLKKTIYSTLVLLFGIHSFTYAATTATAIVTFTIASIDSITVSGNPAAFVINSATAGSPPTTLTDTTTTYAITTNNTARKITGAIDTAMPTGVTLSVALAAPSTGTSAGTVALSTTAANLVTAIANVAQAGLQITYTLAATVNAAPAALATRTVTYTVGP